MASRSTPSSPATRSTLSIRTTLRPSPRGRLLLASSPFTNFQGKTNFTQNTSLYCAQSGAFVFATGTMDWAWGLAPGGSSDGAQNNVRRSLKRLTANVLNRMLDNQAGCASAAP